MADILYITLSYSNCIIILWLQGIFLLINPIIPLTFSCLDCETKVLLIFKIKVLYCVSLLNYNELIFNLISFVHSLSQKEITYVFQFVDTLGDNSVASETPNRINANTNIMNVMTMWWELIVKGKNIISYLVLDIFKFGNYYMWISIFRLMYVIVAITNNCDFASCIYFRSNYTQLRFFLLRNSTVAIAHYSYDWYQQNIHEESVTRYLGIHASRQVVILCTI